MRKPLYQSSDIFKPDAELLNSVENTFYGRISIQFLGDGSVIHNMQPVQGIVSENEVILNIRLTYVDIITLYAARRLKIEPYETSRTTRLTPMQPNLQRSDPNGLPHFSDKPKPVDFSFTELDLLALPNGICVHLCCMFFLTFYLRHARGVVCYVFWRRLEFKCHGLPLF